MVIKLDLYIDHFAVCESLYYTPETSIMSVMRDMSLSCVWLCDPMVCSPPLFMDFSRKEYWSGLPFPSPGDLPDPGTKHMSLASTALGGRFFTTEPPRKPMTHDKKGTCFGFCFGLPKKWRVKNHSKSHICSKNIGQSENIMIPRMSNKRKTTDW